MPTSHEQRQKQVTKYGREQGIYKFPWVTEARFHLVLGICSFQLRDLIAALLSSSCLNIKAKLIFLYNLHSLPLLNFSEVS